MKKIMDPDPAGQKSTDPTGSGTSFLVKSENSISYIFQEERHDDDSSDREHPSLYQDNDTKSTQVRQLFYTIFFYSSFMISIMI